MYLQSENRMFSIKLFITTISLVLVLIFPSLSHAELIRVTGVGQLTYANQVTAKIKAQVIANAKLSAFRKFMAGASSGRQSVYENIESQFLARLDVIIPEYTIQREIDDSDAKEYKVLLSAAIDSVQVDRIFDDAGRKNILGGTFVTLFVARVATEQTQKKFDDRRTKVSESDSAGKQRETAASSASGSVESIEKQKFSRRSSGGSRVKRTKRAKLTYEPELEISGSVGSAIGEVLVAAGYETVPYDELDVEPLDEVLENGGGFKKNGKLKKKLIKEYRNAAKDAEIKYFGYGDIEIGIPQDDPVTGQMVLTAYVNFKVWDVSGRLAKEVATVKKKMVKVSGTDQRLMEMKAGNAAAIAAGNTVISQLQIKAIEKR
jgi:hypothetical protein